MTAGTERDSGLTSGGPATGAPPDAGGKASPTGPATPPGPTAPAVALPSGGGAIRGIGEKFTANPATGTGTVSVPLAISPGRSGFTPALTLQYDSGSGNGAFGFGWRHSLPSISRKTDKGLPRYAHDPEDIFVLSGAEDLVVEPGPATIRRRHDRTYSVRCYRPRVESLFARIERWRDEVTGSEHWRSISRDDVTTRYGTDPGSRIADPDDPGHVFSWLISESYDRFGNLIRYEYKADDSTGVDAAAPHERHRQLRDRTAARYPKRIRYGNRIPAHPAGDPAGDADREPAADLGWMFEVVFDYGEHDLIDPRPEETGPWLCRRDPFSSYRAGFEVRTYRLCQRVLMFHHFPDEDGVGANCLTTATAFAYQGDARRGGPIGSLLTSVLQSGFRRDGDGYRKRSFPPLEFSYTPARIDSRVRMLDVGDLPAGVDGPGYQWLDLDGEGVSGVLTGQGQGWFYRANLGAGRFAPNRLLSPMPSTARAGDPGQQFVDLDGDGCLELVDFRSPGGGSFARTDDGGWAPFHTFAELPTLDWEDRNLRLVDLTGNGHADVLITEDRVFSWSPSLAETGFGRLRHSYAPGEADGPRVVFADPEQSVYLADMSGDGLVDLVRIRNGQVCYWPNLGYGRFGAKVVMDDSPWFDEPDQFDQRRIRVADVDGSGVADLIYLHRDHVQIHRNTSGNGWAPAAPLPLAFPRTDQLDTVATLDLLGTGTPCLVWSSTHPVDAARTVRYVDLMSGGKPHLLTCVRNNLGAETRVHYTASTRYYLADKAAGRPWATRLPFPVQVAERVETFDRVGGNRFSTRYAYHHGFFDGVERQFNGFGMVEQWDTADIAALAGPDAGTAVTNADPALSGPPVLTRTWYHPGAYHGMDRISRLFASEYYRESDHDPAADDELLLPDTVLPDPAGHPLSADELRQACRALKGSMLRQEIYALDGTPAAPRPYSTVERTYAVRMLQRARGEARPGAEPPYAVFLTHARETLTANYERALYPVGGARRADPRVSHEFTLEVDDYGNVRRSAAVSYGRRHADRDPVLEPTDRARQAARHIVLTETDYTNAIETPDAHRLPVVSQTRAYEVLGLTPGRLLRGRTNPFTLAELDAGLRAIHAELPAWEWDSTPDPTRPTRRLTDRQCTLLRRDDLAGPLPPGVMQPLALPYESYRLAFADGQPADLYGDRVDDAMLRTGGYVQLEGSNGWWVPGGRSYLSVGPDDDPATELSQARAHFFRPRRFTDPLGSITRIDYDRYDLLTLQHTDPVGNVTTAGERDTDGTLTRVGNDYRTLQARLVMDANRNRAEVSFDALGMVTATAVMGKPGEDLGDTLAGLDPDPDPTVIASYLADPLAESPAGPGPLLAGATTRIVYDLMAYLRTETCARPEPAVAVVLARETHGSDLAPGRSTGIQPTFSYSDGFGREIQKKARAESGPGGAARWIGSGWVVFNAQGRPVRRYEPFFTPTHRFEFAVAVGVSPVLFYDPLQRAVATINPLNTWEKVVFDPWGKASWDGNDTVLTDPGTDPDIGGYVRAYLSQASAGPGSAPGGWRSWYQQRIDGERGPAQQRAARDTAAHAATPARTWLDSLGRAFLSVAMNRTDTAGAEEAEKVENYCTRKVFDIEGNERAVIDALGRTAMRYGYDQINRRLAESSMEAGARFDLVEATGRTMQTWSSRGISFRTDYDDARRPVRTYVRAPGEFEGEILLERIDYGEGQADAEELNLRGRTYRRADGGGLTVSGRYDFKGNLLDSDRQLPADPGALPDWAGDVELEPSHYPARTSYDALNRPTERVTPDDSRIRHRYNEANLLQRLEANLRGASEVTVLVEDIDYNPRGQRTQIRYGNGVRTEYDYEPETFRLTRLLTRLPQHGPTRDGGSGQDLHYTYDPVGNITRIGDDAQPTAFFGNRRVDPAADYRYDAVYRLVEATGREHLSRNGIQDYPDDAWARPAAHPNDAAAMARYRERYDYDPVGNLRRIAHRSEHSAGSDWTRRYRYAESSLLEPDRVSNRLTGTTLGSAPGSDDPFGYDAHGNITSMPGLPLMRWDVRDQLRASGRQVVGEQTPATTVYGYDSAGQRVRKSTERPGSGRTERLYLGSFEVFRQFGPDGELILERQTLHVLDDTQRVALVETRTVGADDGPDQLLRYQLGNHLGSVLLELDAQARLISYEEYHPYGTTAYQAAGRRLETPKRYRYTGKERDEETSLYYHGARYYAPGLGRWTSCDPVSTRDQINLYQYVRGNPVAANDPLGLWTWGQVAVVAAVVTVAVVVTVATAGVGTAAVAAAVGAAGLTGGAATAATAAGAVVVGAAAGAAGSAAADGTAQKLTNPGHDVNWNQVQTAAESGAVTGAVTAGLGTAVSALRGGASAVNATRAAVAAEDATIGTRAAQAGVRTARGAALGFVGGTTYEGARQQISGERAADGGFDTGAILTSGGVGALTGGALDATLGPSLARLNVRATDTGFRAGLGARGSALSTLSGITGNDYIIYNHGNVAGRSPVLSVATPEGVQIWYQRTGGGGLNAGGAQPGEFAPIEGWDPTGWFIKDQFSAGLDPSDPNYRLGSDTNAARSRWVGAQGEPRTTTRSPFQQIQGDVETAGAPHDPRAVTPQFVTPYPILNPFN